MYRDLRRLRTLFWISVTVCVVMAIKILAIILL